MNSQEHRLMNVVNLVMKGTSSFALSLGNVTAKFSALLKKLCGALWYIFLDTNFLPDFMLPVVKNRPANAGDTELGV